MSGLKLMWVANSPFVGSGYGVQSRHILPYLAGLPEVEKITIFAFYGLQGGRMRYPMGGRTFEMVPTTIDDFGNDAIINYAAEFRSDVVITLMDIWPLSEEYGTGVRWCPYAPFDSETPSGDIAEAVHDRLKNAYLPIVYSQYADRLLERLGYEHVYAPHGYDPKVFRPMPSWKKRIRRDLGWPEDAVNGFAFGMVAANKGYPPRKGFPEAFEAFARIQETANVWLYLHTIVDGSQGGLDLRQMGRAFGIADRMIASNKHLQLSGAFDDGDMAKIYNAFDCLLMPSYSEGFGIPAVESQACGVPVIVTDAFAQTELCGSGWLVPWDHRFYLPLGTSYVMPSVDGIEAAMRDALVALGSKAGRREYGERAVTFAQDYAWPNILDRYWRPIIERLHREITPRIYQLARPQNGIAYQAPARELVTA